MFWCMLLFLTRPYYAVYHGLRVLRGKVGVASSLAHSLVSRGLHDLAGQSIRGQSDDSALSADRVWWKSFAISELLVYRNHSPERFQVRPLRNRIISHRKREPFHS